MLSQEQSKNILYVYTKLISNENEGWSIIDDLLESIQWITDQEISAEAEVLYSHHKNKNIGCPYQHEKGTICFVNNILEAAEDIIQLYKETKYLPTNNRYILEYYLALYQSGAIVELLQPER